MIKDGLVQETKNLIAYKHYHVLKTIGYTEIFNYFDNQDILDYYIEKIKINTKKYAKKQITWFKKNKTIKWIDPQNYSI